MKKKKKRAKAPLRKPILMVSFHKLYILIDRKISSAT